MRRAMATAVVVVGLWGAGGAAGVAAGVAWPAGAARVSGELASPMWVWPVASAVVVREFRAPMTRYSAGHRGIDLVTQPGEEVVAPTDGVVSFAGVVGERSVVSVAHAGGLVSTLEPVAAAVHAGEAVARGQPLGTVATGGHCDSACLHLGVRRDGGYINPRLFYGGVPRAVLKPLE
ncbi:hypothetical protein GCM10009851_16490 [Herbiconiux moechotypicola]|uniref:M23ase beta-sheet core domain-containing protein n=2 Tax=Herbiconiux moechotypicola TaxID=637393 RepID=A0ABP5QFR3_9MICO